jgi:transposase
LVHEGFVVSVINPTQARHFTKALLERAKTEAIDAQTLAQLAMVLQPEPWRPPPPIYHALQQRLAQRDDLLNLRQQVDHQLHALRQHPEVIPEVRTRMERLPATFEGQLTEVEAEITAALRRLRVGCCRVAPAKYHRRGLGGSGVDVGVHPQLYDV